MPPPFICGRSAAPQLHVPGLPDVAGCQAPFHSCGGKAVRQVARQYPSASAWLEIWPRALTFCAAGALSKTNIDAATASAKAKTIRII
jgi:hypothetical protein